MSKSVRASRLSLPWLYTVASKILRKVKDEGESLNGLIYNTRGVNIKAVYGIVAEALKHFELIDAVIHKSGYANNVKHIWIARVLATELLFGKGELIGDKNNLNIKTALQYQPKLREAFETLRPKTFDKATRKVAKPRYIRVNTLLTSVEEIVNHMEEESWELLPDVKLYEDFLYTIKNLSGNQFIRDYHLEDVLVFPIDAQFYEHPLYLSGKLVLQDKASCLSAHLLNPKPGSTVLDLCAAPGMKTTYLAALMNNKGTLYAVEKHRKRYLTMCEMVEQYCGSQSCVRRKLGDALEVNSEEAQGVEFILVDPSCTGSGITRRVKDMSEEDSNPQRLRMLSGFQEKLLTHALTAFPDVQRVVYSTCSINHEENEQVVENVLAKVNGFQVIHADLGREWKNRGDYQYSFGSKCLRANFEEDLTDGFFIAVIERMEEGLHVEEQDLGMENNTENSLKNFGKRKGSISEHSTTCPKKSKCQEKHRRRLKKKRKVLGADEPKEKTLEDTIVEILKSRKRKKKKKRKEKIVSEKKKEKELLL